MIFMLITLIAYNKTLDSRSLKEATEAKRITIKLADNLNAISEQGTGYFRYFQLPEMIREDENYTLRTYENYVELEWANGFYSSPLITGNVTIHCLDYGVNVTNRILNENGMLSVTCHRPSLRPIEGTLSAVPGLAGVNNTFSISVENDAHVPASSFTVMFTNMDLAGACSGGHPCWGIVQPEIGPNNVTVVSFNTIAPAAGDYEFLIEVDSNDDQYESIESDNNITQTLTILP